MQSNPWLDVSRVDWKESLKGLSDGQSQDKLKPSPELHAWLVDVLH